MARRTRLVLIVTAFALIVTLAGTSATALALERPEPPAAGVIVVDAGTGDILFDQGSRQRLDPAGLTELFTAFYALETTPQSRMTTISPADLLAGSSAVFRAGEQVSVDTLVNAMLLANGDDAALAIARSLGSEPGLTHSQSVDQFMTQVNARLGSVGLSGTQLVSPYGDAVAGHFSSARDVAALVVYALRNEPGLIERLSAGSYSGGGHTFTTQNLAAQSYSGILGGIGGETASLQIAERDGRTLIAVVLGAEQGAQSATLALQMLDYGFTLPPDISNGRIVFPDEAPVGGPATTSQLAVTAAGDGAAQVHAAAPVDASAWNAIKWPLAAALTMIVLLVCCVQVRALQRLNQRPPARRGAARRRAPSAAPRPETARAHREGASDRPVYLPDPGYSSGIAD